MMVDAGMHTMVNGCFFSYLLKFVYFNIALPFAFTLC
jgi:hypothetical protein